MIVIHNKSKTENLSPLYCEANFDSPILNRFKKVKPLTKKEETRFSRQECSRALVQARLCSGSSSRCNMRAEFARGGVNF